MNARELIDRVLPERLRKKPALDDDKLFALLENVEDNDRCLAVVMELLARQFEWNFLNAGALTVDPKLRDELHLNAHLAVGLMQRIEGLRTEARARRVERQR